MKHSLLKALKSTILSGFVVAGLLLSSSANAQTSIAIMGNDTICMGDSVKASAMSTRQAGVHYTWSDTLGSIAALDTVSNDTAWLKPTMTTVYRVIGDSAGVMDTAFQTITVWPYQWLESLYQKILYVLASKLL